jgi:hypothetical protein
MVPVATMLPQRHSGPHRIGFRGRFAPDASQARPRSSKCCVSAELLVLIHESGNRNLADSVQHQQGSRTALRVTFVRASGERKRNTSGLCRIRTLVCSVTSTV